MILAFKDINPVAPVHIVIVPKYHIECANDVDENNSKYVAHIFEKIPEIAKVGVLDHTELLTIVAKTQAKVLCICFTLLAV